MKLEESRQRPRPRKQARKRTAFLTDTLRDAFPFAVFPHRSDDPNVANLFTSAQGKVNLLEGKLLQ